MDCPMGELVTEVSTGCEALETSGRESRGNASRSRATGSVGGTIGVGTGVIKGAAEESGRYIESHTQTAPNTSWSQWHWHMFPSRPGARFQAVSRPLRRPRSQLRPSSCLLASCSSPSLTFRAAHEPHLLRPPPAPPQPAPKHSQNFRMTRCFLYTMLHMSL